MSKTITIPITLDNQPLVDSLRRTAAALNEAADRMESGRQANMVEIDPDLDPEEVAKLIESHGDQ